MANIPLRQIRAVIAVCEEGSFTRAAQRENATQSGISQHVAAVERALKVKLFERTTGGVTPTPAGLRYYKRCVEAVGALEHAAEEARSMAGEVTGELRIGLMPTFTRAVLAPVLDDFVPQVPGSAPAHRRGLQRAADRDGARRRTRFRGGALIRGHHRTEVAHSGARP